MSRDTLSVSDTEHLDFSPVAVASECDPNLEAACFTPESIERDRVYTADIPSAGELTAEPSLEDISDSINLDIDSPNTGVCFIPLN